MILLFAFDSYLLIFIYLSFIPAINTFGKQTKFEKFCHIKICTFKFVNNVLEEGKHPQVLKLNLKIEERKV